MGVILYLLKVTGIYSHSLERSLISSCFFSVGQQYELLLCFAEPPQTQLVLKFR